MKVAIVGTGLIGGSLALALKKAAFASKIIGVDQNPEHLEKASSLKIIDETATLQEACKLADMVILTIPVDAISVVLPEVLDFIPENTTVVDMGSTKEKICASVAKHSKRSCFVAAHPIAGTENTGPEAAIIDLFTHKKTIICEKEKSNQKALEQTEKLFHILEMSIEYMTAKDHDLHIAYVSHLSHISSFTLGLTVLEKEKNEKLIFNMAGSGFASTVRLAKSSPEMWAPIFDQNKENISDALGTYIENLQAFKDAIDSNDRQKTQTLMEQANAIRKVLDKN